MHLLKETTQQRQDSAAYVIHTIFCANISSYGRVIQGTRHFMIILLLCLQGFSIFNVIRYRGEHPLKQRAPRIAILHMSVMLMYILILYSLELFKPNAWKGSHSFEDVSYIRRLAKSFVFVLRFSFIGVFCVRLLVIGCQWIRFKSKQRIFRILSNESMLIIAYIALIVAAPMLFVLFDMNGSVIYYPSLVWYDPGKMANYKASSLGFLNIFELSLLVTIGYLMRDFPSNFGVKVEIIFVGLATFLGSTFSFYLHAFLFYPGKGGDGIQSSCSRAFFPYFTPEFTLEIFRVSFLSFTIYWCNRPKLIMTPTPTRLLSTFKVFIVNRLCLRVFTNYLNELKDAKVSVQFEEFLREQIKLKSKSGQLAESQIEGVSTPRNGKVDPPEIQSPMAIPHIQKKNSRTNPIPSELYNAFCNFQETFAFDSLRKELESYEWVFHLKFNTN